MTSQVNGRTNGANTVHFFLDGQAVEAQAGESIWDVARRYEVQIPVLCYKPDQIGLRADGNCRVCMVEIEGERLLQPSCWRQPTEGMKVHSCNERARHSQEMVLEMLESDTVDTVYIHNSRLTHWSEELGVEQRRFAGRDHPVPDPSHPAIDVNLDACIHCTLCVRACREVQGNDVIGYAARGSGAHIMFDIDDPMGESTCVGCGECVAACPTGALSNAGVSPQNWE